MMQLALKEHKVSFVRSPNHSPRPAGIKPRLIVLHSTGGAYRGALRWLCDPASTVSAHFLVSRAGEIVQLAPLERAAWHAGVSRWQGHAHVNQFSIGIEMEHLDRQQDWPPAQLAAVADLCRALLAQCGLAAAAVVGHADVAWPRGRKIDPVAFPWAAFRQSLVI